MKRAEALKQQLRIGRTCRGNMLLSAPECRDLSIKWQVIYNTGDVGAAREFIRSLEDRYNNITKGILSNLDIPDQPDWNAVISRALMLLSAHEDVVGRPCGYD